VEFGAPGDLMRLEGRCESYGVPMGVSTRVLRLDEGILGEYWS
jgi:hypothetical protein